jgi:hypothetical protein
MMPAPLFDSPPFFVIQLMLRGEGRMDAAVTPPVLLGFPAIFNGFHIAPPRSGDSN